jgi:hypothetical protein
MSEQPSKPAANKNRGLFTGRLIPEIQQSWKHEDYDCGLRSAGLKVRSPQVITHILARSSTLLGVRRHSRHPSPRTLAPARPT